VDRSGRITDSLIGRKVKILSHEKNPINQQHKLEEEIKERLRIPEYIE